MFLCRVLWGPMCADREYVGQKAADPVAAKEEQAREREDTLRSH